MKTKVIMSVTIDPKIKARIIRATKEDGGKISPIVEALLLNYLEVREVDILEKQRDPLSLRA